MSPILFVVWVIIAVGIIAGLSVFYNSQADVRLDESEILNFKIQNCLKEIDLSKEINLLQNCKLNKEIIEDSGFYYIYIKINDREYEYGTKNFKILCSLEDKSSKFPRCFEKELEIDNYKIKILTASNQQGEKLRR